MILFQYGTMMRVGTVDFYPGSGDYYGCYQPGCGDIIDVVSCSHSRYSHLPKMVKLKENGSFNQDFTVKEKAECH